MYIWCDCHLVTIILQYSCYLVEKLEHSVDILAVVHLPAREDHQALGCILPWHVVDSSLSLYVPSFVARRLLLAIMPAMHDKYSQCMTNFQMNQSSDTHYVWAKYKNYELSISILHQFVNCLHVYT